MLNEGFKQNFLNSDQLFSNFKIPWNFNLDFQNRFILTKSTIVKKLHCRNCFYLKLTEFYTWVINFNYQTLKYKIDQALRLIAIQRKFR